MKKTIKKLIALGLLTGLILVSCSNPEEEIVIDSVNKDINVKSAQSNQPSHLEGLRISKNLRSNIGNDDFPIKYNLEKLNILNFSEIHSDFLIKSDVENAVNPTLCGDTAFDVIINEEFNKIDYGGFYNEYSTINFYYAYFSEFFSDEAQYFGEEGQYTNFMKKATRNLENFWNMPNEITVKGQHNSTLDDREKLATILYYFFETCYEVDSDEEDSDEVVVICRDLTVTEAYGEADFLLYLNSISTFYVENPLLSLDGFATSGDQIVIGDGIVELLTKVGVEDKIVWTGILAHEWAHEIQFNFRDVWYPNGAADNTPEATRTTELEADFFAAYYMTHKRGATYNWKRVEEFLEVFYNIGDCYFDNDGHHGTPSQRMDAANQGYLFAKAAQKNGHILSADEVHKAFLASLEGIVN